MVMQHNEMWAGLIDLFPKPFRTSLHIILFFHSNVCHSVYMPVHIHSRLLVELKLQEPAAIRQTHVFHM